MALERLPRLVMLDVMELVCFVCFRQLFFNFEAFLEENLEHFTSFSDVEIWHCCSCQKLWLLGISKDFVFEFYLFVVAHQLLEGLKSLVRFYCRRIARPAKLWLAWRMNFFSFADELPGMHREISSGTSITMLCTELD